MNKPFELDHEEGGEAPNLEGLGGTTLFATRHAVVGIFAIQLLASDEMSQAILKSDSRRRRRGRADFEWKRSECVERRPTPFAYRAGHRRLVQPIEQIANNWVSDGEVALPREVEVTQVSRRGREPQGMHRRRRWRRPSRSDVLDKKRSREREKQWGKCNEKRRQAAD
jgi:hypothetical protein